MRRLMQTSDELSLFILRLALGIVIFPHGAQKVFAWFGGHGFSGTMQFFGQMGIPSLFAFLAIMAEFLGSLGLITGLLTRVAAFGITINMIVAALMVHLQFGFFMNWTGQQAGEGFEFHLLAIGIGLALMLKGGGWFSLDHSLSSKT